jgi:hypothetical protein
MQLPTKFNAPPLLALFLKLTAVVAIGIVVLVLAGFLLKIVLIAAIIAALGVGGFFLYSRLRRAKLPVIRS